MLNELYLCLQVSPGSLNFVNGVIHTFCFCWEGSRRDSSCGRCACAGSCQVLGFCVLKGSFCSCFASRSITQATPRVRLLAKALAGRGFTIWVELRYLRMCNIYRRSCGASQRVWRTVTTTPTRAGTRATRVKMRTVCHLLV